MKKKPSSRVKTLDGIRCIAVTMVVVGHALPATISYEFLPFDFIGRASTGVTLFFVLSGYLITSTFLHRENFSLLDFFKKRILRLWPTLYVYLFFLFILNYGFDFEIGNWQHFVAASLHLWNYSLPYVSELDRYQTAAAHMMHLWSLAMEEQFYYIWPLIFFSIKSSQILVRVVVLSILVIPILRLISYSEFQSLRPFVSKFFHTAAEPLLFGCLLALLANPIISCAPWVLRKWVLPFSLILLISVSYFVARPLSSYWSLTLGPSIESLIACSIILSAHRGARGRFHEFLELSPIQIVGLASYSIYIWQNIFTRPYAVFDMPFAPSVGVCFLVGIMSYHIVESPVMKYRANKFSHSRIE